MTYEIIYFFLDTFFFTTTFFLACLLYTSIQKRNLLNENDEFPYRQKAENCNSKRTWSKAESLYSIDKIRLDVENFNNINDIYKKGIAVMPICFGISFTNTSMNQASALVHICLLYTSRCV